jgi:hypothetical protein
MTRSQIRAQGYVDAAMTAAINALENQGLSEQEIADLLSEAIDTAIELSYTIAFPASSGWATCWELTGTKDWVGQWIANGGPLLPWNDPPRLIDFVPAHVDCQGYFADLAILEDRLARQLKAVDVPGWSETLSAAADEAKSRVGVISGPFVLPWWLLLGGAWIVYREIRG